MQITQDNHDQCTEIQMRIIGTTKFLYSKFIASIHWYKRP